MLDEGPSLYHRAVLRLLYEYLRLQEPKAPKMHALINSITAVVHRHLKGSLWREAVDLLKLTVSNSAALVQPPTRGLPVVDLGLFNQTLPGPTLQFSMDLKVHAHVEHTTRQQFMHTHGTAWSVHMYSYTMSYTHVLVLPCMGTL